MSSQSTEQLIALVTGANRGLGLEISRQLGRKGYLVLLGCRSEVRAAEAEGLLRAEGIKARAVLLDVASPSSIAAARDTVERRFPHLDTLINNAAIHYYTWQRVTSVDWDIIQEALDVNTFGPWRTSLAFLPLLRRSPHPRIVNVSSEGGSLASMSGGTPAYSLSKCALHAVTRMLASELRESGILVNAVCPGWTATDMGGEGGRPLADGARGIVSAATLPDTAATGGFFRDGAPLSW